MTSLGGGGWNQILDYLQIAGISVRFPKRRGRQPIGTLLGWTFKHNGNHFVAASKPERGIAGIQSIPSEWEGLGITPVQDRPTDGGFRRFVVHTLEGLNMFAINLDERWADDMMAAQARSLARASRMQPAEA